MSDISSRPAGLPEIWGGIEGTVNRVGDRYFDQMRRSGHWERIEDLDLIAALGIQALRYPVLWEHIAPNGPHRADWTWPDARLARLRQLGVRPIVGLVHHGSGPRHTSLVDPAFPLELARYARAVAERYPWVEDYTPVNEPLTTGRFSGLYGHWYPHGKDHPTFARTLMVQCRAIVEAMRAIREVNPRARLIQTEDMGRTYSTPHLAYQAEFENHRRWLSLDLLCGRIDRQHPLWSHLLSWGCSEVELGWFLDNPMPPDVVGINYYITSDRLLDERMEHYPEWSHGGNERDAYTDVHVAGVWKDAISGHRDVLAWAWERYKLPVAFTEVHLGCTREDQLRWLGEAWDAVCSLRAEGVDVRALTVWSLLGAYDWNTLVTADRGFYEPGVFDMRSSQPRLTALAWMTHALAKRGNYEHPVLASPGWWRRDERAEPHFAASLHGDGPVPYKTYVPPRRAGAEQPRPVLISGATGTLGRAFARLCTSRGIAFRLLSRQEMDIASPRSVESAIEHYQPWAIINAAGYVRVDDAEAEAERCFRENALGPEILAAACHARDVRLITFSSDLVFGGERRSAYLESNKVQPLNQYGRSKAEAERRVLERMPDALVVRTGAFFGPWDPFNFVTLALGTLARGARFAAVDDVIVSPTYVPDLVHTCLDLLLDEASGVWHLTNAGEVTWAELATQAARVAGLNPSHVEARPLESFGWAAARPRYSALASERAQLMPPLTQALERYLVDDEIKPARRPAGGAGRPARCVEGRSMKVMVTGGAGYIGSVVTEELLRGGDEVVVYDSLYKGHREAVVEGASFVKGDLLDTELLRGTLIQHKVEAVVHMAADSLVGESVKAPAKYYRNNVLGGLSLLDAMREAEVKYLVFSSTAAVYGEPAKQPIEESDPTQPTNPYGETKLAFERALRWYDGAYGLRFVGLRYFNAAGATERCGERHSPETHLIPLVLQAAAGQLPEVTVFGDDYPTPDGTCVRDYIHVVDLAQAHVRSLHALAEGHESAIYNLGCGGEGYSVKQVIDCARRVTGRDIPVRKGPRRPGDPAVLIASSARIMRELGWRPSHQKLDAIVESAWRFMQKKR